MSSVLGHGGMGVVLRAHDPLLDRPVALKRLLVGAIDDVALSRLHREAQAMAQVTHPNVVEIYDVIHRPEGLVIAMELVEGSDLRQWLTQAPRTLAERLDVMRQAGRGLVAVHEAGLVHRDFKPATRSEARSQAQAASEALARDKSPRAQSLRVELEDWRAGRR